MHEPDDGSTGNSSLASDAALSLKVVVIGDPGCGKSSMVTAYTHTAMPESDNLKPFEIHSKTCELVGEEVHVGMWDASGVEAFDRIRPLSYMQTDAFMICFSIVQPASFDSVRDKWSREVQFHAGEVPCVLVGIMADMRDNEAVIAELAEVNSSPVTLDDGKTLADEIGAMKYIEVSSLTRSGLEDAIDKVLTEVVDGIFRESHHEDDGSHLPGITESPEDEEPSLQTVHGDMGKPVVPEEPSATSNHGIENNNKDTRAGSTDQEGQIQGPEEDNIDETETKPVSEDKTLSIPPQQDPPKPQENQQGQHQQKTDPTVSSPTREAAQRGNKEQQTPNSNRPKKCCSIM